MLVLCEPLSLYSTFWWEKMWGSSCFKCWVRVWLATLRLMGLCIIIFATSSMLFSSIYAESALRLLDGNMCKKILYIYIYIHIEREHIDMYLLLSACCYARNHMSE
jgi:hypothetical protein